jgi:imidazolonepropionase-like amidohydrolase
LVTAEDAKQYVHDRVTENVDYIKLMHESGTVMGAKFPRPTVELQKAVIDEAHKAGIMVVAHATCLEDTVEILEAGVDGLTHCFIDQPPTNRVLEAYKRNNAHCNPTLSAMGSGTEEGKKMQEKYAHDPRVSAMIPEAEQMRMCACMSFAKKAGASFEHAFETVQQLKANGIEILW